MRTVGSVMSSRSGNLAQEALVPRLRVRREAVGGERFLDGVVEDADLADLARFLAAGDLAAELARDADQLLDLPDRAHLARAVLVPEVVLDAAAHVQAHRHA